ncbi:uncharacterized protein ACO6RY_00097 [Pungitius sinensis]
MQQQYPRWEINRSFRTFVSVPHQSAKADIHQEKHMTSLKVRTETGEFSPHVLPFAGQGCVSERRGIDPPPPPPIRAEHKDLASGVVNNWLSALIICSVHVHLKDFCLFLWRLPRGPESGAADCMFHRGKGGGGGVLSALLRINVLIFLNML